MGLGKWLFELGERDSLIGHPDPPASPLASRAWWRPTFRGRERTTVADASGNSKHGSLMNVSGGRREDGEAQFDG